MKILRLPLVHDRRADRTTPVAAMEFTEADLRLIAVALSHSALDVPMGWRSCEQDFENLGRRMKRVAGELRKQSINENGAAPADTGPRPTQEVASP